MKKHLSLLIIGIFLLSGCTIPYLNDSQEESLEVEVNVVPDEIITEKVVQEVFVDEEMEVEKIFNCDMLRTESFKKDCKNMINEVAADMLSSEIRRNFNISRCDELSDFNVENCKKRIEKTGIKGPITEKETEDLRIAQRCVYKSLVNEGSEEINEEESKCEYDITKCSVLITPGLKGYCEKKINEKLEQDKIWEIVELGDVIKCDTLTSNNAKSTCKMELGVYIEDEMPEGESE